MRVRANEGRRFPWLRAGGNCALVLAALTVGCGAPERPVAEAAAPVSIEVAYTL